eukprot:gnl/TRDRNA2_/TRDRNA2_32174_c0_seq1.p1 gnl/TRDRNA2_/TRDRNA2_32174_c0~~gnl/TRDRNA2_/TRDRNA2_32174_c0_seq1.p1  ORF type:complete len:485 (+),score=72.23 gnl/TRDRNA2_/TRDRNA2_32174_c0_seq1:72-1526(+)
MDDALLSAEPGRDQTTKRSTSTLLGVAFIATGALVLLTFQLVAFAPARVADPSPLELSARVAAHAALPRPQTSSPLINSAKRYFSLGNKVKQQLGPTSPETLEAELADDFEFVAPIVGPLGKKDLIAATTGLDFAAATPDFDAQYHDFRVDTNDPQRIWCTMRVKATQTGVLKFGGIKAEPKSPPITVHSPPEAVSLRFDNNSKLRELTTGYPLDRRSGTTGGLGGIFGVLEGLGYPLPPVLTRPTGYMFAPLLKPFKLALPTAKQDEQCDAALRPPQLQKEEQLPEETLLNLTAALMAAELGTSQPSLLSDDHFSFCGPVVGPLGKSQFLAAWQGISAALAQGMPDLEWNYRDASVDPHDVNRVWVTSSPTGTHTGTLPLFGGSHPASGRRWISAPERSSFTFDREGRCVAITGGYVMDRRMGNTDGLGGLYGLAVALGLPTPSPRWLLRTPSQNMSQHWKMAIAIVGALALAIGAIAFAIFS